MKWFDSLNDVFFGVNNNLTSSLNLSDEYLINLYRTSEVIDKVVNLIVEDSVYYIGSMVVTRSSHSKFVSLINSEFKRLDFWNKLIEACKIARLLGDGYILLITNDEDYSQELNLKSFILNDISVLDPTVLLIESPNNRGEFTHYNLNTENGMLIHKSRVLRIAGKKLFSGAYVNTLGRNDSVVRVVLNKLLNWDESVQSAGGLLKSHSLFLYRMKNLASLVKSNEEGLIKSRLKTLINGLTSVNGLILDSAEDATFIQRNYLGVQPILSELKESLASAAGLPYTKLWGTPTGGAFSESGASDRYEWANTVDRYQNTVLLPVITRLIDLILNNKITYTWVFENSLQLTENEKAEIKSKITSSDINYINSGVLTAEEVRESRFADLTYNYEINLKK